MNMLINDLSNKKKEMEKCFNMINDQNNTIKRLTEVDLFHFCLKNYFLLSLVILDNLFVCLDQKIRCHIVSGKMKAWTKEGVSLK